SIDWCCLPHLDSPSVCAAILDDQRGGRFQIAPLQWEHATQRYLEDTNVLLTEFTTRDGSVRLTDFMPIDTAGSEAEVDVHQVHRSVECLAGEVEVAVRFAPRLDYGRGPTHLWRASGGLVADHPSGQRIALGGPDLTLNSESDEAGGTFRLRQGQRLCWTVSHGTVQPVILTPHECDQTRDRTARFWRDWVHTCEHPCVVGGPWHSQMVRSLLVLKLLASGPSGGIAAAATTSLPEAIGGSRNWDYRFAWIRDASLTLYALGRMGHVRETTRFLQWFERICRRHRSAAGIRILYALDGGDPPPEQELDHLEGYRGSAPVRIGNGAADQRQLDIYGEILNAAWWLWRARRRIDPEVWAALQDVADWVCTVWQQPDWGIWEVRNGPWHFVYSKVMCWVALDRAIRMAEEGALPGHLERWRKARAAIRDEVLARGWSPTKGAFVQHYDTEALDASALLIPLVGFLPITDPRVQSTIEAVRGELSTGDLLYRYRGADGLPGEEGAFLLCSFWLVNCYILSGRLDEASALFQRLRSHANHVGLFAEQVNPATGEALGNFPQAFTHIGFIVSGLLLGSALGLGELSEPDRADPLSEDASAQLRLYP
ncbi:MAG: glycoside hydrolase family 15 protein, partial [Chloroflexi bacterium]|nr:glycoside hydrolase family 15 protein [Chloroflexota bacterium]